MTKNLHQVSNQELLKELFRRLKQKQITETEITWTIMKHLAEENLKNHAQK